MSHYPSEADSTVHEIEDEETGVRTLVVQEHEGAEHADPRDNDNLGVMAFESSEYVLGDKGQTVDVDGLHECECAHYYTGEGDPECEECGGTGEVDPLKALGAVAVLPLRFEDYRHAGACYIVEDWDDANGVIYATRERCEKLGAPVEDAERQLRNEVEEYNLYLNGEVFYITSYDADGERVGEGPIGGFIGEEYAREEAAELHEYAIEAAKREVASAEDAACRDIATV